jgi:hypothetical protein
VGGLATDERNRNMPHRRIGFGAMPMALTGLDMDDITDSDLALVMLGRHHAGARGRYQQLVTVVRMPPRGAAPAEIHHAAVIVGRVTGLNDGLARPGDRACVSWDRLRSCHRGIWNVLECDHLHDDSPFMIDGFAALWTQLNSTT